MTVISAERQITGWTADDSSFGARLALVRQRMGWGNLKEAAVACGLPVESWRSWERDNRTPRNIVEIARIIAERTGCDYGWLLAGPRMAGVHRATGHIDTPAEIPAQPLCRNLPLPVSAPRSSPPTYPDRVRPRDRRPISHPTTTVQPPTQRRPTYLARRDLPNAG